MRHDDVTNKFSREVKIKHYKDEIKRVSIVLNKLKGELEELESGTLGIKDRKMRVKGQLSFGQRILVVIMAVITAFIGIGLIIGGFIYYITNSIETDSLRIHIEEDIEDKTHNTEKTPTEIKIEETNGTVRTSSNTSAKRDLPNEEEEEETQCLLNGTLYDKPENAHCLPNDPKNAWECNDNFEEKDEECIENKDTKDEIAEEEIEEELELISSEVSLLENNDDKCLFENEYVEKPKNAFCIQSSFHAWKCQSGFVEVNNNCVTEDEVETADIINKCLFSGRYYSKPENAHCTPDNPANAWECDSGHEEIEGYKCVAE